MVRDLFEFGRERSVGQAIGFYLVYLVAGSILVVAATALLGTIGDQPGQAALMVTRPAEGSRRVSDERATVVAYANGTTRVTVRGDSGHDTRVEIAPDGSATVVSGGSSIVSRSADATTITVNDVKIVASADGTTSVRSASIESSFVQIIAGAALSGLLAGSVTLLVLRGKRRLGDVGYLLIAAASVLAGAEAGMALGLILPAVLTVQPGAPSLEDARGAAASGA